MFRHSLGNAKGKQRPTPRWERVVSRLLKKQVQYKNKICEK